MFRISNLEFRNCLGFRILKLGFRGHLVFSASDLRFCISNFVFRIYLGFRILKLGFRGHLVFRILKLGFILTLLFIFMPTHIANAGIISKPPSNLGLVGYWSMNEGTGTYAGDASGNKNTGTLTNGPTWVDGKRGKALNFDGSDDYVDAGNILTFTNSQTLTLSAWFKIKSFTNRNYLIARQNTTGTRQDYAISVANNTTVSYSYDNTANPVAFINWTVPTIPADTWNNFTVTVFSNGTVTGYFNGVALSNQSGAHDNYISTVLNLGRSHITGSGPQVYINGLIDEVRVYNRALSAGEIQALYNSGAAKIVKTITFDNAVTASSLSASTLTSTAFTVAPNATYLYVGVALSAGNSVTSVTAGATGVEKALTKLDSVEGSMRTEYWYIVSPPTGSIKVTVNIGAATEVVFGAASYKGVNTTTPHGTLAKTANDSSTSISVTVTSASGELVVDSFAANAAGDGSPDASQTARWSASSGSNRVSRGSEKAGAASVSMIWTSGSGHHALIAVPLKPKRETKINSSQNSKLTNGLVGMWSFNGPDMSGTTAYDRSGQGNNGTLTNGPSRVAGKIGQALSFDGVNDYVSIPDSVAIDVETVTVSAWIKTTQTAEGEIIEKWINTGTPARYPYVLRINNATVGKAFFRAYDGTNNPGATSTTNINNGAWHHLVGVRRDGTDLRLYVDGVLESTATDTTTGDTTNDLAIGIGARRTTAAGPFNGLIDEVRRSEEH